MKFLTFKYVIVLADGILIQSKDIVAKCQIFYTQDIICKLKLTFCPVTRNGS